MSTNADFTWLVKHSQELAERYPRKWVAIWNRGVIAVGDNAVEVVRQADQIAPSEKYIIHAICEDIDMVHLGEVNP